MASAPPPERRRRKCSGGTASAWSGRAVLLALALLALLSLGAVRAAADAGSMDTGTAAAAADDSMEFEIDVPEDELDEMPAEEGEADWDQVDWGDEEEEEEDEGEEGPGAGDDGNLAQEQARAGDFDAPPWGMYTNSSGIFFLVDIENHKIDVYNQTSETLLTSFGGLGDGDGEFNTPYDVAQDPQTGLVYVADGENNRVQQFTPDLQFLRKWEARLPQGVAVGPDSFVYVAEWGADHVSKWDAQGNRIMTIGSRGKEEGQLHYPFSVAVHPQENTLYVLDAGNSRMTIFNSTSGEFIRIWGGRRPGADADQASQAEGEGQDAGGAAATGNDGAEVEEAEAGEAQGEGEGEARSEL